ncbi:hypothetical protein HOLleu_22713 [Holothuria leucospilota]|uniref:Uncharacterized protein n=1 Tax=Holothuria leucospilota TaxID=206669 RepID=A0A9Q1BZ57_HOLLE|nr:hypothetical protein HOLleu_22713 [Holothuria leucospilota]
MSKLYTKKLNSISPWFNDDIHSARKLRRQLERKWRQKGKLEVCRQEYCKQRGVVATLIRQAKVSYYSTEITNSSGDQKKLFRIVNNLLHKPKDPVLPSAVSDRSLACRFSQYFVEKIEQIRKTFTPSPDSQLYGETSSPSTLCTFQAASEEEIKKIVMKSASKSCELDSVPTTLIKQCIDTFVPYITDIVNASFSSGHFPTKSKDCLRSSPFEKGWFRQEYLEKLPACR